MKGSDKVIQQLSKLLSGELAARDQYFTHSRIYADLGLNKLYERINHEMADETQHASWLIERILFLEGTPDLSQQDGLKILIDTEQDHAYWLEKQLKLIDQLGLPNYLQSQA